MLIAIEGCIGVGKSTVAEGLARFRKSETLLEAFELNPFLSRFYENPGKYALETEFAFLLIHFHQVKHGLDGANREVISDFFIAKDLIYADLNMHDSVARAAFQAVFDLFNQEIVRPDVLVCLSASDSLVLERIRKRNRAFELMVEPAYYARLNAAFEGFFEEYQGCKIRIDMNKTDFVRDERLFASLSDRIDKLVKA